MAAGQNECSPARPVTILADKGQAMNSSCYPATHNHLINAAMGPEQPSFGAAHNQADLATASGLPSPRPPAHPRQRELLQLVAAGHTNAQIARRLGISGGTARTDLENIYERLQVSSRTAAVTRAFPDRVA